MKTGIIFKKFFPIFTLVLLAMLSVSTNVTATDGDLDTSFNIDGLVTTPFRSGDDSIYSIAIQPDEKIIVAGESNDIFSNKDFALARYTNDGFLDSSFGTDGKITADFGGDEFGRVVALQSDGKIVVAGYSETTGHIALARYTSNGSPDSTFGTDGKVTTDFGSFNAILAADIRADGKIVLAGGSHNGSNFDIEVIQYNTDGSLDTGFGTGGKITTRIGSGDDIGAGLIIQPDGKIVVTGFSYNGSDNDFAVVRYLSDGTLDTGFGTGGIVTTPIRSGDDTGLVGTIQPDGKIVVAGYSHNGSSNDFAVVRYNSDGTLDTNFGNGGIVTTLIGSGEDYGCIPRIQSDGKIIVTGDTYNGSDYDIAVIRYNADGSLDASFGSGGIVTTDFENGDNRGSALAIQSDGNILVAGHSTGHGGVTDFSVVRYLSDNSPSAAEIYSPAPGSTLHSASATFRWNNSDAEQYWLWIGTSAGSNDLGNWDKGADTSATVSGLPTDGETLYVRLWSKVNGEWVFKADSTYTACNNSSSMAEILSPASGSTLGSTTETFTWSDTGAEQYWLWIGTSAGGNDVGNWDKGTDTSATISGLPGNGETLYARLWSKVSGEWVFKADSTYTACNNSSAIAEILSPASGSTLSSTTETFAWNDTGADQYWLWIGTSAGSNDVANLDQGTDISATVSGLPGSGETLYVRLWSKVGGEWLYKSDSVCTATGP
ncbi:MAG: hypothetical protein GY795_27220 [Desulfobacterales bacterium]|nr:hypothetical protein [Desulfobacterales bacterium]